MKVRFLFYKARFEWRNFLKTRRIRLVDNVINVWTWAILLPQVVWEEKTWNLKKWGKAVWEFTKACYSHCEVWLPDRHYELIPDKHWLLGEPTKTCAVWFDTKTGAPLGTCYTSTMRDEQNGTVKRPARDVLKHPERWDYVEIDIPEDLFFAGKLWMNCQVRDNKGYGFKDIGKFFGLGFMADKYRNICSEFVFNYCIIAGIFKLPFEVISPRRLSRMFNKAGYKIKRLSNG